MLDRHPAPRLPAAAIIVAIVGALLAQAADVEAQTVAGRVVERGTGQPLEGAFVVLLDSAGVQRAGVLTDSSGVFSLQAPVPGSYSLRADLIGHASTISPALKLAAGQTLSYMLEADVYAIPLAGLEVRGEQRCETRGRTGEATARLWEEARKALAITAWAQARSTLHFRTSKYRRVLDPGNGLAVVDETRSFRAGYGMGSPFRSVPARELADSGYMRPGPQNRYYDYYAPDADVLLSDSFVDGHCFHVAGGHPPQSGWIGLAFEPIRRDRPDVRGVLWLDRQSAELRTIEFHYANLPWDVDRAAQGGFIAFSRVPGGPWIVTRWWIRMPSMQEQHFTMFGVESRRTYVLTGVEEVGGEVLEVRDRTGKTLLQQAPTS